MAGTLPEKQRQQPEFVMTAYRDGAGMWFFRLKFLHDGREQIVSDVQELLCLLKEQPAKKENHA